MSRHRLALSFLRLVWPLVLLLSQHFVNVHSQTFCQSAETLSRTNLNQSIKSCTTDLSTCSSRATCPVGCSVNTGRLAVTACTDGCTYTSGGYSASRTYTSGYSAIVTPFGVTPVVTLGFSHNFTAGPLRGNFVYTYDGFITDDSRVIPKFRGTCSFQFNGVDCACGQFYCNAVATTYNNRINCTNVPGGAAIDFCKGVSFNKTLSPLEILYLVPSAVCLGREIGGGTPVVAPAMAPMAVTPPMAFAPTGEAAPIAPAPTPAAPSGPESSKKCGLFKLGLFCLNGCGLFGRILGLCK